MPSKTIFIKHNESDKIWWVEDPDSVGVWQFSFDKQKIFNLFADYPYALTKEEQELFDKENPYWANFFRGRKRENGKPVKKSFNATKKGDA